ncbi:hypothetical protein BDF14DRAFT_898536 [Spinellus fusiger]|nr:hypothetical protein BDF14DRAFT_898536 [Spinellus fusiger]
MPNQMPNQMPVPTLTPNFTQAPPPDHAYAQEQPSAWGGINSSYSSFHSQNNSLPQSLHESSYPPQYSQPNGSYGRAPLSTHFSTAPTILSDIPGLIPLIPMTQENSNPLFGATHQGTAQMDYQHISDEDLLTLSETTRESMMQRLVLLERTQSQIFHSMQILAQALSVIPTTGLPQWNDGNKTETSTSQTYSTQSTSSLGETTVKTVADPHVESVNESLLDTSSSSKQKGKMIDNSTPLNE